MKDDVGEILEGCPECNARNPVGRGEEAVVVSRGMSWKTLAEGWD